MRRRRPGCWFSSYAADMDERATHSLTGPVDAHPAVSARAPIRAERTAIDGEGAVVHDEADLTKLLKAIAARIDTVLDAKVAAGAEPEGRHRAARAWSSVVGKRATDATPDLRRHALATTVLRISADGRLDIDDRERAAGEDAADPDAAVPDAADQNATDQDATDQDAESHAASVRLGVSRLDETAPPDRPDVEDRLRVVRERLATRHASATEARPASPGARVGSARSPSWRRGEMRTLVQRLLIGLAIVGASAVVSILIT